MTDDELIEFKKHVYPVLRKYLPNIIAHDLVGDGPVTVLAELEFRTTLPSGKSEEWLIENGYEPVDAETRIIWTKKNGV